jgi:hypothetical protein
MRIPMIKDSGPFAGSRKLQLRSELRTETPGKKDVTAIKPSRTQFIKAMMILPLPWVNASNLKPDHTT